MEVVLIAVSFIAFSTMVFIVSFRGLDLRRWSSWFYGAFSFLCGLTTGFLISGNLIEGLKVGAAFAFMILVGGAASRWHKQRSQSMASSLLLQYGKEDDASLFAKLVRRLLGKHK